MAYEGDRACSAEATLARVQPCLARFGITRVGRLTGLDRIGIPVWHAVSPNSRSIVINQGKGFTDLDARVSATMEALERAVACDPAIARRLSTAAQLADAGDRYEALPALVAAGMPDLADDELIDWVVGLDIVTGAPIWVPFAAIMLDRTVADPRYWQSSDGLASGNNLPEATLHGLLERIERDAYVLWSVSSGATRQRTCVDPSSFSNAAIDHLATKVAGAGLELRLFDITSDIGVPAFSAFLADAHILLKREPLFHDVTAGHGAHLEPHRAAIRAITEAAQSRLTYISGARDDVFPHTYRQPLPPETRALFEAPVATVKQCACHRFEDPDATLAFLADRLQSRGIGSAIRVDLGGDDLPFSVVKVVVPDLENPDGRRKRRFGYRALSRSLETS